MYKFVIEKLHYDYLVLQRGGLSHIKDLNEFTEQYGVRTQDQFLEMLPYLPVRAESILDIGSGLGGIDVLLSHYYDGKVNVELLDGIDNPPEYSVSYKTFNNMSIAKDFLEKNGVLNYTLSGPETYTHNQKDLIISKASYCFHYSPEIYLLKVLKSCKEGTILIFDVRVGRGYEDILEKHFTFVDVIGVAESGKYSTMVFQYND